MDFNPKINWILDKLFWTPCMFFFQSQFLKVLTVEKNLSMRILTFMKRPPRRRFSKGEEDFSQKIPQDEEYDVATKE